MSSENYSMTEFHQLNFFQDRALMKMQEKPDAFQLPFQQFPSESRETGLKIPIPHALCSDRLLSC